jgi:prepilin-type N-terminal cleavage/methylation domain-containing protein
MKIVNCKLKIKNKAFTLIEIMVAIAIMAILAGTVLVSMKSYGARSRSTKALAQLSSAIPSMISCWGNGGNVNQPNAVGGNDICRGLSSYGQWPTASGDYRYNSDGSTSCGMGNCIDKSQWWVYVESDGDNTKACCNMTVNGCASTIKTASTNCNKSLWTD